MKVYLTTPLYYLNDVPHIGHAYTQIATDVLARYYRKEGYDVFFLTGTDEHGQKMEQSARAAGKAPQVFVDEQVEKFKALWKRLNISYDDFIRTSESRHGEVVQKVFKKLLEKGDIYLGEYEGWYCTPCESFFLPSQLDNGKCPDCGRAVHWVKEESYFFKMSKYQNQLLEHIRDHKDFILPTTRRNEISSFIKEGLKDVSVSRTSFSWGVPLPEPVFRPGHIAYVWIDALLNYVSAPGFMREEEKFKRYWPADVHLIGKDILKFHAVIWPALLLALDLPLPRTVFAHGWWTVEGEKMSKSRGNVVDPWKVTEQFGVDSFRYFLLREVAFGLDGDFSTEAFIRRYNADLANDLGNLFQRTLSMVERYFHGKVPATGKVAPEDEKLRFKTEELPQKIRKHYEAIELHNVLSQIWDLITLANRYIEETAPWKLAKTNPERLGTVLYNLLEALRWLAFYLSPFLPETSEQMNRQLGSAGLKSPPVWGQIMPGGTIRKGQPLFPRMEKQ